MRPPETSAERIFRGVAASGGVVHGRVLRLGSGAVDVRPRSITADGIESELDHLHKAIAETRHQILEIHQKVLLAMGAKEAAIFEAHGLVLEDPALVGEISRAIREGLNGAEYAVQVVCGRFCAALEAADDPYLRERAADVQDVSHRVIRNLLGEMGPNLANLAEPVVLVAPDLSPSATALLDRSKVLGFATDRGGITGHTAIVARKLRIPAVVGLGDASKELQTGDHVLIDGHDGVLVLSPTDATLFRYGQIRERREALEVRLQAVRDLPAVTLDGVKVGLAANIDEPSEVASVRESGAHGVGLFRTEFLFLNSEIPPDEDRQYAAYRAVAESLTPAPVVIRTLDLGGDKLLDPDQTEEQNPFLGWRAIRISLSRPDMFRVQLRAVLRASAHGRLRLMFPMISGLEELLEAKALLEECRSELSRQGIAHDTGMQVGMMVEVPAAALLAGEFAPHVDFFSLGTNDLTQYTLAVDRLNPRVALLHSPAHPAVIRLIHATVRSAREHGRWVGVCGEMAGDPALIPLLVGLGVDELSVTPALIPAAKHLLRRLRRSEAVVMAERALSCSKASEVLELSRTLARSVAPELFSGGE